MKKTINDIFDEASVSELENLINQNKASEVSADTLSAVKSKVYAKTGITKAKKSFIHRPQSYAAVAACLAIIIGTVLIVPMLRGDDSGDNPSIIGDNSEYNASSNGDNSENISDSEESQGNDKPVIPFVSMSAPKYYGSDVTQEGPSCINPDGISVTAKLVETLPDTYTVFQDWSQHEFRLLRMKTEKLLHGSEMTDEFLYLIPEEYMTDFSVFDTFVIGNMKQYTYEYCVMYNKTQGRAEQLNLVIFGYGVYTPYYLGRDFMAFDSEGNFDGRLWNSTAAWIEQTKNAPIMGTVSEAEEHVKNDVYSTDDQYVHLLKDISGDAREALERIKSFDNGVFVPSFSIKLGLEPEVQFNAVKYIDGFATNEKVRVWSGKESDTYEFTKAHFGEEELKALPNLASAVEYVASAYERGEIAPPHIANHDHFELTSYGIFGWYAKTTEGVVGVVRFNWRFYNADKADDAYYIIGYGSDECKPIDRDALLELFGEYETTNIYLGEYTEDGIDERSIYLY